MDINEIDQYLSGEMKADEQTAFEKKMQDNPALSEQVADLRLLTEGIEDVLLEDRISEALTGLPKPEKQNRSSWWLGAVLLVGAAILGVVFYPSEETNRPPAELPSSDSTIATDSLSTAEEAIPPPPPVKKEKEVPQGPIASNEPTEALRPLPYPAPKLRGTGQETDSVRQAILNSIWHTPYPPESLSVTDRFQPIHELLQNRDFSKSYARLQFMERQTPENDTLFFLKGYCLLESGEGNDALRYFDQIKNRQPFGADLLEWYRGLSLLLMGEDEKAKRTFLKISETPDHPFKRYAASAVEKLK
ncbi:MAG: hypothetical protein RIC19_02255 [Phaeodactylibacter sp.]|uniref:hypothetical protein n=1 Tax=Phaeodactylibacter sp. TaxID=1940289 RepID=UPI0032EC66FE